MIDFLIAVCIFNFQICETQKQINYAYVTAVSQGVNPNDFLDLVSCESRWNFKAKGDYRSETGEFMAQGLLQWWPDSFKYYAKFYNLKLNRNNPYDQIDLALLVLADGGEKNWFNCVKTHNLFGYKSKKLVLK